MRISDWSSDVCSSELEALEALAELAAMAQPSSGADPAGELEEALDEATYWAGKLFDQCRAAAAALAWLPQSLAADPVPPPRELARAAADGDRKSVVGGRRVSIRVDFGGRRILQKQK